MHDYRARLSLEVGDLSISADSTSEGGSTSIKVYRIEAVEHLPAQGAEVGLTAASLAEVRDLSSLKDTSIGGQGMQVGRFLVNSD